MTEEKLNHLPLGTRVTWNRAGVHKGHAGEIALLEYNYHGARQTARFIQWDDGTTLNNPVLGIPKTSLLRWVKRV